MKKILFCLTCVIALLSTPIPASAYSFAVANDDGVTIYYNYNRDSNTDVTVTYSSTWYGSYRGVVNIPETVDYSNRTYTVTAIGESAFKDCTILTSISIPGSVTSIGQSAFNGCTKLKEITFEDGDQPLSMGYGSYASGITTTSESLFSRSPLETVYLGRTLTYNTPSSSSSMYYIPFYNKSKITSLTIGNSVTSINAYMFYGCSGITELTVGNSVTTIGNYAFQNCSGITELTIPNSVTDIGTYAFQNCSGITELTIPNSVTDIGTFAFQNCSGITELTIGNSVTDIGAYAFQNCSGITELTIGNSVTSIGNYAFSNCSGITELTIGNSVTTIGNYAFRNCRGVTELIIPTSVTTIGNYAFQNCTSLLDVVIEGTVTSVNSNAWDGNPFIVFQFLSGTPGEYGYNGCLLTVPNSALTAYQEAWPEYMSNILPIGLSTTYEIETTARQDESDIVQKIKGAVQAQGYNTIGDAMCAVTDLKVTGTINSYDIMVLHNKAVNLKHLDLSEATIVANSYLYYDNGSTKLASQNNVIGKYFLYDMQHLIDVKLPNSATTISDTSVYSCPNLKEIVIGNRTITISNYAFGSAVAEKITLGENVKTIGTYAFASCKNLKEIIIPSCVESIGANAFSGCSALNQIKINGGVAIGNYAFDGCSALSNVVINDEAAVTLGSYAFQNCTSIGDINTGRSTTSIGSYAFKGCTGLKNVTIGETTEIGQEAFAETGITSLTTGNYVKIGNKAFYKCLSLVTVTLGQSVQVGQYAFAGSNITTSVLANLTMGDDVTIDKYAFQYCTALTEVTLPKNLKVVNSYAFDGCSRLETVHFPPGLETIKSYAFRGCRKLEAAILPLGLEKIETYAFQNCTSLREVKIPSTITSIGNYAFNVGSIRDVYTWTIEPTNILQETFAGDDYSMAMLHVPATANKLYYYDTQWSQFLQITNFSDPYEYFYLTNKDLLIYDDVERLKGVHDAATNTWTYPSADLGAGSAIVVKGEEPQYLGNVRIVYDGTKSTTIIGGNASQNGDANLNIDNLVVEMAITKGRWYFFSFPFDLDFDQLTFEAGQYVWRWYDSEKRAREGGGGWTTVAENADETPELTAMQGYIFQASVDGTLVINVGEMHLNGLDMSPAVYSYDADNQADANWNLIGNPNIGYYEVTDLGIDSPVTVYDHTTKGYKAKHPRDDEYQFHPFEGFFWQRPRNMESSNAGDPVPIPFYHDMYETYNQSIDPNFRHQVAQRRARRVEQSGEERMLINLVLTGDTIIDESRVVFNENKTMDYDLGADAAKFMSDAVAQIYTLDAAGNKCAINERPLADGTVKLGFWAPAEGQFTISSEREDISLEIYDAKTGDSAMLYEGYTFTAGKGTDDDRFILRLPQDPTGIENVEDDAQAPNAEYYGVDGINYGQNGRHGVAIKKQGTSTQKVYNR